MSFEDMMKEDAGKLVKETNPLFLKDGLQLAIFSEKKDCYLALLNLLCKFYPRGYIEVANFFVKCYGLKWEDAIRAAKSPVASDKVWLIYVDWGNLTPDFIQALKSLAIRMHKMCGSMLNTDELAFLSAINEFTYNYNNKKNETE